MKNKNEEQQEGRHDRLIRRHYEPRISPHRPHHEVLDWASEQSQRARFEILCSLVDLKGKSLLDIGCGLGDLLTFIQERKIPVQYTGVDLLEKMVLAARHVHPAATFIQADLFTANPFSPQSFDIVFCSGAFNLNLGNNSKFLPQAIDTMLRLSRLYVVFNLLHHRARGSETTYFYYDPDHVRQEFQGRGYNVEIVDDYLHNDFTVICRKPGMSSAEHD